MKRYFWKFYDAAAGENPAGGGATKEIKTSADLLKELGEIKTGLEKKAKEDAQTAAKEIIDQKLTEVNTRIDSVKGLPESVTPEQVKQMWDDLQITMKSFDRFQIAFKNAKAPEPEKLKSFDERILEAVDKAHDDIEKFKRKEIKKFTLDIKAVGAVSTGNLTGSTTWGAQRRGDIIMVPNTMTHLRDLIPVTNAGPGTDYYFMYESGNGEGSIAATAETTAAAAPTTQATGLKPQFDLDLVEASVKFEYIAGWMLMSRKALNNIPGFSAFLQRRLPVKLMDAEDQAILYGNGTSPNIKGILASGNFTASTSTADTLIEKIIDDMSLLEDTYKRLATGIAIRPRDYYSFFKNKASGSGEYDLPQGVVFSNGILYILGVPVAKTTALATDDYVVGDFQNGAELLVQEAMTIGFFEQDSTNVRSNQITVRIEESIALPVYGANYFIKGSSAVEES